MTISSLSLPDGSRRRATPLLAALVVSAAVVIGASRADLSANFTQVYPYLWLIAASWTVATALAFDRRAAVAVAGISAGPVLVLLGVDHLLLRSMGYAECGRVLQEFLYNHHGCVDRLQVALATSSVVVGLAGLVAGTAVLIRRSRRRSAPPPSG